MNDSNNTIISYTVYRQAFTFYRIFTLVFHHLILKKKDNLANDQNIQTVLTINHFITFDLSLLS